MNDADADAAKTDLEACEEEGPSGYINIVQDDASMFLKRTPDNGRVTAEFGKGVQDFQFWSAARVSQPVCSQSHP